MEPLHKFPGGSTGTSGEVPNRSALLAVEHVADGSPPRFVHFALGLAGVGIEVALFGGFTGLWLAARRTTVGEAGLIRPQLELLRADDTGFDRKCHTVS